MAVYIAHYASTPPQKAGADISSHWTEGTGGSTPSDTAGEGRGCSHQLSQHRRAWVKAQRREGAWGPYQRWHRKSLAGRAWARGCPRGRRSLPGTSLLWLWLGTGSWHWYSCPGRRGGQSTLPTHRTSLGWRPAGRARPRSQVKGRAHPGPGTEVVGGVSQGALGNAPASQGPETWVRFSCPQ